jgi:hypothetical protein
MDQDVKNRLLGVGLGSLLMAGAFFSIPKVIGNLEQREIKDLNARGYVALPELHMHSFDNDGDGRKDLTVANYQGTNYLFRVGTNGIPYFEPMSSSNLR